MAFDVEQFFQSVDIILTQRLNDLSYDKTIVATIIDDSDKAQGHYIVSDGTINFDAYSNDTAYRVDDQVRVTILNGDWSQKKFIAGKYSDGQSNIPLTYTPPLDTVMQDNQSTLSTIDSWTLQTNGATHVQPIWNTKITEDSDYYTLQTNGIYNVITLQGDFQTYFDAVAGNYGLLLELYISPSVNSNERIRKFMTFDSSEMFGNPYSYKIDSHQAKQILIASEGIVTEVILSIYQARQFDVKNGKMIEITNPFIDKTGNQIGQNDINFKNIVIGFGSDLTQIEDNTLKIYTSDPVTYHYANGSGDEYNNKSIGLIWQNKNDNNQYVGFSDGVIKVNGNSIEQYDEIAYLKEEYSEVRLINQKGKSGIPTDEAGLGHAADIEEAKPLLKSIYESLTGSATSTSDLVYNLQSMSRSLGNTTLLDELKPIISSYTDETTNTTQSAKLVQYASIAEQSAQRLAERYGNVLQYAYESQNQVEHTKTWNESWDVESSKETKITLENDSYFKTFISAINNGINVVTEFLTSMDTQTAADQPLGGYRGVYESYNPKINKAIAAIEILLEQVQTLLSESKESSLKNYQNKSASSFVPYAEKDLSDYHNRYCIYWYRYNEKYIPDYESDEYKYGMFLGDKWERVQVDLNNNQIQNIGLPTTPGNSITENGKTIHYFPASPEEPQFLERKMDPYTAEERYQAVLFYNHIQVSSNVLVFLNSEADQIPAEFAVDAGDTLVIEHGAYSQDHYQSYTSAFDLVNIADESRSRQLRVSYNGLLSGDEALADATIYWYVPTNSTMLTYDEQYLVDSLNFHTDINAEEPTQFSKSGYVYFCKNIQYTSEEVDAIDSNGNIIYNADGTAAKDTIISINEQDRHFAYKIKPFYEPSAQNNTILVEAHVHGKNGEERVVKGEIFFTFSTFGSNGTKYTFVITPASTQIAILPAESLDLKVSLRNAEGALIPLKESFVSDEDEDPDEINTYNLKVNWHARNDVNTDLTTSLALTDIEDSEVKNLNVSNSTDNNKYSGIVNAKVSYLTQGKTETENRVITLSTLYPVAYSSNENYYISGPTTIVYNNQGVLSRLNEEPFKLYSKYVSDEENSTYEQDVVVENQSWSLIYYNNKGEIVSDDDIIQSYMPILNSDNTITPAPMYYTYEDNSVFYVPVAQCKVGGDIVWTQPIVITQNQYASSTLNDWNGEFVIDEANGTILSTMLGAGRKTENNTFEGVLMGDIEAGANFDSYNADGLGIYGFNDGAQSFYFGVNGKAFIGKSTAGRILFDGNNSLIYSQKWLNSFDKDDEGNYIVEPFVEEVDENGDPTGAVTLNAGKDGLAIDLQNGHIDAYNFKVTSNNVYLNSNPPDEGYFFRIGNNGSHIDDSHTDYTEEEEEKYGVMTPGYVSFSKEGDLEIRANSLSLTGQLGGVNLLRQTQPRRAIPVMETKTVTDDSGKEEYVIQKKVDGNPVFDWDVSKRNTYEDYEKYCNNNGTTPLPEERWNSLPSLEWEVKDGILLSGSYPNETYTEINKQKEKDLYLAITASNKTRSISQIVEVNSNEFYTISGYVIGIGNTGDKILNIVFNNDNITTPLWSEGKNTIDFTNSEWVRFEYTFKTPEEISELVISFECENDFALWHAKLEYGSIATEWSPAPQDTVDTIAAEQEKYDIYLDQDKVFDKLITQDDGQKMVGIWLLPGEETPSGRNELYINATYMSTGILRSSNWDGAIGKIKQIDGSKDKYGRPLYTYEIVTQPTQGLYLNLDEGKMWAAKFELNAWNDDKGLYVNSHPLDDKKDYYFRLGDTDNHITFTAEGELSLKSTKFTLESDKVYLSDTAKSFDDVAGQSSVSLVLKAGDNFGVTQGGTLYCTGAQITGNITATTLKCENGTIGGWSIGKETLTGGGVTLNSSTGTIDGASITAGKIKGGSIDGAVITGGSLTIGDNKFSVKEDGSFSATSGSIGGWTITPSALTGNGISLGGGGISSTYWTVGEDGKTTITDLEVTKSASFTSTCQVSVTGNIGINVTPSKTYDLYVNGYTVLIGNAAIGTVPNNNYSLNLGGSLNIGASLYVGGTKSFGEPNVDTEINIDTPYSMDIGKMTFRNGILVGWNGKSSTIDSASSTYLTTPSSKGTNGDFLMLTNSSKHTSAWTTVTGYTTDATSRNYAIKKDSNNKFYTTINTASADNYGVVKTGYTTDATSRQYKVSISSGNLYTTISTASSSNYGVVKIGYSTSGNNRAVQLNSSGQMYVTVPAGLTEARVKEIIESYGYTTLSAVGSKINNSAYCTCEEKDGHTHTVRVYGW